MKLLSFCLSFAVHRSDWIVLGTVLCKLEKYAKNRDANFKEFPSLSEANYEPVSLVRLLN